MSNLVSKLTPTLLRTIAQSCEKTSTNIVQAQVENNPVLPRYITSKISYNFLQVAEISEFVANNPQYAKQMPHLSFTQQQLAATEQLVDAQFVQTVIRQAKSEPDIIKNLLRSSDVAAPIP